MTAGRGGEELVSEVVAHLRSTRAGDYSGPVGFVLISAIHVGDLFRRFIAHLSHAKANTQGGWL